MVLRLHSDDIATFSSDAASAVAEEPPQAVVLLLAAGMGLVAGLILSAAQWRVLRRHVTRAWQWLPANAIAWAAGMPLIFAGVDVAQNTGSVLVGVLVMGGSITITGRGCRRNTRDCRSCIGSGGWRRAEPNNSLQPWEATRTPAQYAGAGSATDPASM